MQTATIWVAGARMSIVDNITGDATYVPVGFAPPSTGE
jgi:hypothetical protein